MANPILLVWKSYPAAGKTCLSDILQQELGFNILEYDAVREKMYGKRFADLTPEQQKSIWPEVNKQKYELLNGGSDVIIDATNRSNSRTRISLDTTYQGREIPADKYLAVLRVDRKELERRELVRKGTLRSILLCDEEWEEPEANPKGYQLLEYNNNNFDDQKLTIEDLKRRFGKGIIIPHPSAHDRRI